MSKDPVDRRPLAFIRQSHDNALKQLARLRAMPRCSAVAKSTGIRCKRVALANGKCDRHGGLTPSGDAWHRPRWPNGKAPNAMAKLDRKLEMLEARRRKREAALAAMSLEERAASEVRARAMAPGTVGQRAARKAMKAQNAWARKLFATGVANARQVRPQGEPARPDPREAGNVFD